MNSLFKKTILKLSLITCAAFINQTMLSMEKGYDSETMEIAELFKPWRSKNGRARVMNVLEQAEESGESTFTITESNFDNSTAEFFMDFQSVALSNNVRKEEFSLQFFLQEIGIEKQQPQPAQSNNNNKSWCALQ